jgi:hypothetical protein
MEYLSVSDADSAIWRCPLLQLLKRHTTVIWLFIGVAALAAAKTVNRTTLDAQDVDVISDSESYAVFRAVLSIKSHPGDKDLTYITLLQETRAGRMDCPRDKTIQQNGAQSWRATGVRTLESGRYSGDATWVCRIHW